MVLPISMGHRRGTLQVRPVLAIFIAAFGTAAYANDWGYDGIEQATTNPPLEQSAAPLAKSLLKNSPAPTVLPKNRATVSPKNASKTQSTAKPKSNAESSPAAKVGSRVSAPVVPPVIPSRSAPADTMENYIDKDQPAARCWLQLFQACSKQKMEYGQQKLMEAYMLGRGRLGSKQKEELRSILNFWPKLITDLREKPDMEMHYADLFKALLRLHERTYTEKTNVTGSQFNSDADLISELLGLQRIAAGGDPPFTEDAVNAYADMAVFIYEQQHEGRTIDANDNRALFAKVVVEKFNRAPTLADQKAMAGFDLSWAKFKIIWFSSDDKTRKLLLDKLVKTGASSTLAVAKDPLLDLVLSNWPWKTVP